MVVPHIGRCEVLSILKGVRELSNWKSVTENEMQHRRTYE